ncbi:TIGR04283 family arsenosugar biosynthesis glycosyltransferase [Tamlana crocina]|uniref:Glycosyltransferase family 2 protein n=1 Tax=Tamlana crocina TaxID=393006 RepID=A0ABX1D906_9FLAO|nr:TIGR04283 family arsenosugar biosynthesis glycosyltransferase [Tamlana crocina]NJX14858.1 glycosyltransferase family 2 protein [Tamlana crocina]
MHLISTIIPVLNEAAHIGQLLDYLAKNVKNKTHFEIIIVDGGSTDGTEKVVRSFIENNGTKIRLTLLHSEKGRAKQMNYGVQHARGDILYFLHADSFPPKYFDQFIVDEIKKGNPAGCFRMQFDSNHWWLQLASWLTQFNWRACRGGDQSQFITKSLFNDIGGFDERYVIYEDNILINALYEREQFVVINKKLKTSARMYRKHSIWKVQYLYWSIYIKKWLGADANQLYQHYKRHLSTNN